MKKVYLYMPQHGVDNHCNSLTNGIISNDFPFKPLGSNLDTDKPRVGLHRQHDAIQLHHNILIRGGYSCCCSAIVVVDNSHRSFQCNSTVWTSNYGLLLLQLRLRLRLLLTIKILWKLQDMILETCFAVRMRALWRNQGIQSHHFHTKTANKGTVVLVIRNHLNDIRTHTAAASCCC